MGVGDGSLLRKKEEKRKKSESMFLDNCKANVDQQGTTYLPKKKKILGHVVDLAHPS